MRASPDLLTAVSQPVRQRILRFVWERDRAAGDIAAHVSDVTFGAVSQHLKILRNAGAVSVRQTGRHRFYRADRQALGPLAQYLEQLWQSHLDDLKALAEEEEAHPTRRKRR